MPRPAIVQGVQMLSPTFTRPDSTTRAYKKRYKLWLSFRPSWYFISLRNDDEGSSSNGILRPVCPRLLALVKCTYGRPIRTDIFLKSREMDPYCKVFSQNVGMHNAVFMYDR